MPLCFTPGDVAQAWLTLKVFLRCFPYPAVGPGPTGLLVYFPIPCVTLKNLIGEYLGNPKGLSCVFPLTLCNPKKPYWRIPV